MDYPARRRARLKLHYPVLRGRCLCPVTDLITAVVTGIGDLLGAGGAAAAGAGAADAAGAGLLDAGASAALGAAGDAAVAGADSILAGTIADTAGAGLADAALGAGITGGADALTSSIAAGSAADLGAAGSAADLGAAGSAADLGAASTSGLLTGGADALSSSVAGGLPEVTVSAAAPGAAAGGGAAGEALAAGAAGAGLGLAAGGGSPPATGVTAKDTTGVGADYTSAETSDFLPATGSGAGDIGSLSPDVASLLGVGGSDVGAGGGSFLGPLSTWTVDPGTFVSPDVASLSTDVSGLDLTSGQSLTDWLLKPKNALSAGMLGVSGIEALTRPKLPSAAATALGAAGPAVQQAQNVIASGGTATPVWTAQKASIDAQIDQEIKQQTEAIMQAAASSGEGNQNSGIVQQQIAQMTDNANVQRQQLYAQAQQQNVNNAVAELTGGNQTLSAIANMQLAQQEQAQQAARQTAQLALQLEQLSLPGG